MLFMDLFNELFGRNACLSRANHNRCAVCVVGTEIKAGIAQAFWKRTQISVCMYSTRWPMWMGPFAYGNAEVTRILRDIFLP